ncbi:uncharacterized protein LOC129581851 isoform X2 [Paramacrobiotus metropolitanus]|uniref:uncharacterized protein LOC129581851 isoform X2 n=1 Tax=Paramacrobiotus metropolitanus TaxID=2943436 RepID=UPI00244622D7|nr:uncharacterized protein LOC129581851 isoform X2 [Paramacrobiotus metropolitanus]
MNVSSQQRRIMNYDDCRVVPYFGKRRKTKKRSGYPDAAVVRKKRAVGISLCSECSKEAEAGAIIADWLTCTLCSAIAHLECAPNIANSPGDLKEKFYCLACRTCTVCKNSTVLPENSDLLNCCKCYKACHANCDAGNEKIDNVKGWLCGNCRKDCSENDTISTNCKLICTDTKRPGSASVSSSTSSSVDSLHIPKMLKKKMDVHESFAALLNAVASGGERGRPSKNDERGSVYPQSLDSAALDFSEGTMAEIAKRAVSAIRSNQHQPLSPEQITIVKSWSVDDLAQKINQKKLAVCSEAVIRQCIDGEALLLLIREDVVRHFGIPLVHGLKLWRALCEIVADVT